MRRDSLEKRLQSRPKPEDLVKGGILEGMCLPFVAIFTSNMCLETEERETTE